MGALHSVRSKLKGKPILIGRSIAPRESISKRSQYEWIGVRDTKSIKLLKDAGYSHAEYFPDLTFLNIPPAPSNTHRPHCLLTFRERIAENEQADHYSMQLCAAIEKAINWLKAKQAYQLATYHQVDEDKDSMSSLASRNGIAFLCDKPDLLNFSSFFASSAWVISNRLHALLIGAYCGAIPIALTTPEHVKVVSLFETVGWKSLVVNAEDLLNVSNRLDEILNDSLNLSQMVKTTFTTQRELGLEFLKQKLL